MATATYRQVFSPAKAILAAWLCLLPLQAWPVQVELALGTLNHPGFVAEGVHLRLDASGEDGKAEIRIARLRVAGIEYKALRLTCTGFRFDGRRMECPEGRLQRDDGRGGERMALPFSFNWRDDGHVDFSLRDVDVVALSPLVKRLRGWQPRGRVDLRLQKEGGADGKAHLDLKLRDLHFANRPGNIAANAMEVTLAADARRSDGGWRWQAHVDWPRGELAVQPWRRSAGVRIEASGVLSDQTLDVELARLAVEGIGAVTASMHWDRERGEATEWGMVSEPIDLATTMDEWLQPWLQSLGFPAWQARGSILFAVEWRQGGLKRFYAGLQGATLADGTGYLELRGLDAQIPWEASAATDAEISVAGGRFGDLPLGGFRIPLRLDGASARIDNLAAPLLDGRFEIESLLLERRAEKWHAEFSGGIESVSMSKLSRALKLPVMTGSLTARIPRIAYENDVLKMDGALGIEVFDGGMIVHQLRMHDPFSERRHLLVDVTARGLDLGMLTRTFAFGSIEGRFDADLHDLEMAGWTPRRFEARIASSPGEYPRSLSLGALKDITGLGRADEGKTIRSLPERSGLSLGYTRIGLGCTLRDGVCELSGIPGTDEAERVLIMEGSGFPSIDILGYNRHIDWNALVARFRKVLAGREGLVIE